MKFIERLFGKKQEKEESHPTVFEFAELSGTARTEIKKQEDLLRPVVKEKFGEIRSSISELDTLKKELLKAEPIEGASKRGEKLGDSNRDNVANNLKVIHDKMKVPGNTSPVIAAEFYADAKSTLKTVLDNTGRSLMYIKALYPQEHQKINQGLAELEETLDELYSSIMEGEARIETLQKIAEDVSNIENVREDIEQSTKKLLELDQKYESAKADLSSCDMKLTELDNSSEFERAKELENKIKKTDKKVVDIRTESRRLFTPLSKAISRMEKQDENKKCVLSPQNREIIKAINDDPAYAIEYDLSSFLSELADRIKSGDLGLKDQMCDKALKHIQVLNDKKNISFLVEQKRTYLSEREELIRELNSLSIYQEREDIEREMEDHRLLVRSANNDIESERMNLENLREELERLRSLLLSDVKQVFGKDSEIRFENTI